MEFGICNPIREIGRKFRLWLARPENIYHNRFTAGEFDASFPSQLAGGFKHGALQFTGRLISEWLTIEMSQALSQHPMKWLRHLTEIDTEIDRLHDGASLRARADWSGSQQQTKSNRCKKAGHLI